MNNPYPEILVDEVSGVEVPDQRHQIWKEGFDKGYEARGKEIIEWLGLPENRVTLGSDLSLVDRKAFERGEI